MTSQQLWCVPQFSIQARPVPLAMSDAPQKGRQRFVWAMFWRNLSHCCLACLAVFANGSIAAWCCSHILTIGSASRWTWSQVSCVSSLVLFAPNHDCSNQTFCPQPMFSSNQNGRYAYTEYLAVFHDTASSCTLDHLQTTPPFLCITIFDSGLAAGWCDFCHASRLHLHPCAPHLRNLWTAKLWGTRSGELVSVWRTHSVTGIIDFLMMCKVLSRTHNSTIGHCSYLLLILQSRCSKLEESGCLKSPPLEVRVTFTTLLPSATVVPWSPWLYFAKTHTCNSCTAFSAIYFTRLAALIERGLFGDQFLHGAKG